MFEKASRLKLRFGTAKGLASTEDLWDAPLSTLDTIAKALKKELKDSEEDSFIVKTKKVDTETVLKFEIIKHVITIRLEESEQKILAKDRAEQKAQLRELILRKKNSDLEQAPLEDLEARLAAL